MIIEGDRGVYDVRMERYGDGTAVPVIYIRETRPVLRLFREWRKHRTWDTMSCPVAVWECWGAHEQKSFCARAVRWFEQWCAEWEEHRGS